MFSCTSMSVSLHQFFLQEKSQICMCEIIQGYKEYEAPVFGNQCSITVPGGSSQQHFCRQISPQFITEEILG